MDIAGNTMNPNMQKTVVGTTHNKCFHVYFENK